MLTLLYERLNHLLCLSFEDSRQEKAFQRYYLKKNVKQNRLATVLALIANILYLYVVYTVNPSDFLVCINIVVLVIVPSGLLFLWASYQAFFLAHIIKALFLVMVFVGSGAVLAIFFSYGEYQLIYTVFVLPLIGIFLMSGAPFVISLLSVLVLVLAFFVSVFLIELNVHHILFVTFLIVTSFIFSAISGYLTEQTNRKNFLALRTQKELNRKFKQEQSKNIMQERLIHRQARMAQMGEMISMIAHQWRQPLSAIASATMAIQVEMELKDLASMKVGDLEKYHEEIRTELANIDSYVQNLSATIDDFRNFFRSDKKSVFCLLEDVVIKSLKIVKSALIRDGVEVQEHYAASEKVEVYDNEMTHVILNIIKNAQDNFKEKEIESPRLKIVTEGKKVMIYDNGGGIEEGILERIFDPYFSTKGEKNGTGLGLYMSKVIIEEHHNGRLNVHNVDGGVCFTIELADVQRGQQSSEEDEESLVKE